MRSSPRPAWCIVFLSSRATRGSGSRESSRWSAEMALRRVDDARAKQFRDALGRIAEEVAEHGARMLPDTIRRGRPRMERVAVEVVRARGHAYRIATRVGHGRKEFARLQVRLGDHLGDRKSTRLNSSHATLSRMPS